MESWAQCGQPSSGGVAGHITSLREEGPSPYWNTSLITRAHPQVSVQLFHLELGRLHQLASHSEFLLGRRLLAHRPVYWNTVARYFHCCANTPADHTTVAVQCFACSGTGNAAFTTHWFLTHFWWVKRVCSADTYPTSSTCTGPSVWLHCYTKFKFHLSQYWLTCACTAGSGWVTMPSVM